MYLIRLLIVGDTSVGKTSLLIRYNDNKFLKNQKSTIGVDYKAKETNIDGEEVKVQIWDTAGQERFRSMTSAFYKKAQGMILTFDVTQRSSFESLPQWIGDIRRDGPEGCVIVICANKADFDEERWEIKRSEFTAFAASQDMQIFETSASSGLNVEEAFTVLGRQILTKSRSNLTELNTDKQDDAITFQKMQSSNRPRKRACC